MVSDRIPNNTVNETKEVSSISQHYQEGYDAFLSRRNISDNPYQVSTHAYALWSLGFVASERDAEMMSLRQRVYSLEKDSDALSKSSSDNFCLRYELKIKDLLLATIEYTLESFRCHYAYNFFPFIRLRHITTLFKNLRVSFSIYSSLRKLKFESGEAEVISSYELESQHQLILDEIHRLKSDRSSLWE